MKPILLLEILKTNETILKRLEEKIDNKEFDKYTKEFSSTCNSAIESSLTGLVTETQLSEFMTKMEDDFVKAIIKQKEMLEKKILEAIQNRPRQNNHLLLSAQLLHVACDVIKNELQQGNNKTLEHQLSNNWYPSKEDGEKDILIFNGATRKISGDLTKVNDFIIFQLATQILNEKQHLLYTDNRVMFDKINKMKEAMVETERDKLRMSSELRVLEKQREASQKRLRTVEQEEAEENVSLNKIRKEMNDKMKLALEDMVVPEIIPDYLKNDVQQMINVAKDDCKTILNETHRAYFDHCAAAAAGNKNKNLM
jgi:hypothetical protein